MNMTLNVFARHGINPTAAKRRPINRASRIHSASAIARRLIVGRLDGFLAGRERVQEEVEKEAEQGRLL